MTKRLMGIVLLGVATLTACGAPTPAESTQTSAQETTSSSTTSASSTSSPSTSATKTRPSGTPTESGTADASPSDSASASPTGTSLGGQQRYSLGPLPKVAKESNWESSASGGSARIGGTVYPDSLNMPVSADGEKSYVVVNPVRSCSSFTATVGMADDSQPTQVTFTAAADGQPPVPLATVGLAQATPVTFDLTNVATVEFGAYVSGPEPQRAPTAVWGDAVLICTRGALDN